MRDSCRFAGLCRGESRRPRSRGAEQRLRDGWLARFRRARLPPPSPWLTEAIARRIDGPIPFGVAAASVLHGSQLVRTLRCPSRILSLLRFVTNQRPFVSTRTDARLLRRQLWRFAHPRSSDGRCRGATLPTGLRLRASASRFTPTWGAHYAPASRRLPLDSQ